MRFFLAFAFSLLLLAGASNAQDYRGVYGEYLHFRKISDPALLKFAVSFYRKGAPHEGDFKGKRGLKLLRTHLEFSETDINDDGIPELFLVLMYNPYCGTAGCDGAIFRKTRAGYEFICGANLYSSDGRGDGILPDKEHGFHQIEAPEEILHWNESQEPNSGTLCWGEEHFRHYSTSP